MATTLPVSVAVGAKDNASLQTAGIFHRVAAAAQLGAGRINGLVGKALGFGTAILGADLLSAAGAVHFVRGYSERGGSVLNFSRQVGFGVETVQELRYAGEIADVPLEALDGSLEKFNRNLGMMKAGGGPALAFLKHTNAGFLKTLKGAKDNEQAFDLVMAAMARIEDPAKRAAFATALFGKSGGVMSRLVADGIPGLRKLREEKRKYGVMSKEAAEQADEMDDELKRMDLSVKGLGNGIARELLPVLRPLVSDFNQWFLANRKNVTKNIADGFKGVAGFVKDIATWGLPKFIEGLGWVRAHWDGVLTTVKVLAGTWIAVKLVGAVASVGGTAVSLAKTIGGIGPDVKTGLIPQLEVVQMMVGSITMAVLTWSEVLREYKSLKQARENVEGTKYAAAAVESRKLQKVVPAAVKRQAELAVDGWATKQFKSKEDAEASPEYQARLGAEIKRIVGERFGVRTYQGIKEAFGEQSVASPANLLEAGRQSFAGELVIRMEDVPPGVRVDQPTSDNPRMKVRANVHRRQMTAGVH